jgi:hypothetical protein
MLCQNATHLSKPADFNMLCANSSEATNSAPAIYSGHTGSFDTGLVVYAQGCFVNAFVPGVFDLR